MSGFDADDIVFSNSDTDGDTADATATVGDADATDAKTYTAEITPKGTGALGIQVKADAATDSGGNKSVTSNKVTVHVDTDPPTVTISDAPTTTSTTPTNGAFTVKITFNEAVTEFDATDIALAYTARAPLTTAPTATVTVGNADDTDDATYTATITPSGEGAIAIQVKANVAKDKGNNFNDKTSNEVTVYVDIVAPTVQITEVPTTAEPTPTNSSSFTMKITFSEAVTGFDAADDLTLTYTARAPSTDAPTATVTVGDADDTDPKTYTAEIEPSGEGKLRFKCRQVRQRISAVISTWLRPRIPFTSTPSCPR